MNDIEPHKTRVAMPVAVLLSAFGVVGAFCIWLGGEIIGLRRDITDLKLKHVFTDQELIDRVDKRVDERWTIKRSGITMRCDQFPQRGVYSGCREVP